jgi:hypothetical protein
MSLRPEISGFSLQRLFDILGSQDEAIIADLVGKMSFRGNPGKTAELDAVLRRAIHERPRWPDLAIESETHVWAAVALAHHGQTHIGTDSNSWKMPAVWEFIHQWHLQVPEDGRKYLGIFTRGRGIFSRYIETSWSFYGYLALPELQQLLAALVKFQEADPARRGQQFLYGFVDELVGWLTRIEANKKDLWFHCN